MITLKYPTYDDHIEAIKADMVDLNEANLMNIDPTDTRQYLKNGGKGVVNMGYFPRGDNAPYDWAALTKNEWTAGVEYTTDTRPWEAITPWFVTSKGAAHTAVNTGINISCITIQLYDKSIAAWRKLDTGSGNPTWSDNKDYSNKGTITRGAATKTIESDGSWSYDFISNAAAIHGGTARFNWSDVIADYNNIGGVFVKLQAKLVLIDPNGVDDRADAQILICVGGDWWPEKNTNFSIIGVGYLPNICISRFRLVGSSPSLHYMSTLNPPTAGTGNSPYSVAGGIVKMPVATFAAKKPPYIGKNNRYIFTKKHGPRPWKATPLSRATYYASPTGNDGNSGLTTLLPKTLQGAINATVPGDVVFILAGTYSVTTAAHLNLWQDGTAANPIIYEAYPGATVIIDGSGITPGVGNQRRVNMSGSWQKLRGVTVQNMPEYGIFIEGNHNVVDGCTITGNRLSGVICYTSGSGPWTAASFNTIMNCTVYANSDVGLTGGNYNNGGNADGIAPSRGQNNAVIYNLVYGNSDDGIDSWISWGTKIQYNIVRNNGLGIGNGNGIKAGGNSQGKDAIVDHNLCYSNLSAGIDVNTGINVTFISNTTWNNATGYGLEADTINKRNVSKSDAAVKYGTGIATRNSWDISGTLTLLSTTEADSDFLEVTQDGTFNGIGAHYI